MTKREAVGAAGVWLAVIVLLSWIWLNKADTFLLGVSALAIIGARMPYAGRAGSRRAS